MSTPHPLRGLTRGSVIGGVLTAALALGTLYATGHVTEFEARYQLEATQPTIRFLCAAIVTVAATVLALMVTALTLASRDGTRPDAAQFARLRAISMLCTIGLIGGIALLMLLTVPFGETLEVSGQTYAIFYYIVIGASALLGGLMVTMILALDASVRGLIAMVRPELEDEPE